MICQWLFKQRIYTIYRFRKWSLRNCLIVLVIIGWALNILQAIHRRGIRFHCYLSIRDNCKKQVFIQALLLMNG